MTDVAADAAPPEVDGVPVTRHRVPLDTGWRLRLASAHPDVPDGVRALAAKLGVTTEKITKRAGRQLICANEACDYVRSEELVEAYRHRLVAVMHHLVGNAEAIKAGHVAGAAIDGHAVQRFEEGCRGFHLLTIQRDPAIGDHAFNLAARGHTSTGKQLCDTLFAITAFQRLALTDQLAAQTTDALDLAQQRYDLGLSSIVEPP